MNKSAAARIPSAARTTTARQKQSGKVLFRAGERVPPGLYRQVEGVRRQIRLTHEDALPASLDGRVAFYERIYSWGEVSRW